MEGWPAAAEIKYSCLPLEVNIVEHFNLKHLPPVGLTQSILMYLSANYLGVTQTLEFSDWLISSEPIVVILPIVLCQIRDTYYVRTINIEHSTNINIEHLVRKVVS